MKKFLAGLLCLLMLVGCVSCVSATGYERLVDDMCTGLEKANYRKVKNMIDWKTLENLAQIKNEDADADIQKAKESAENEFIESCEQLEFEYDKGYTVEHGNIRADMDKEEAQKQLEKLKKLTEKSKDSEDPDMTAFVNTFIREVSHIQRVKTNLIVRSKDGEHKDKEQLNLFVYCRKGKWYIDQGVYSVVSMILLERENA